MMHLWACDRRQFVDFVTNRVPLGAGAVRATESLDGVDPRGEELALAWDRPPIGTFVFPRAIIVAEDCLADFLAWVLTYFRHIRPFTAHCRILTPAIVRLCKLTNRNATGLDLRSADIGLVVAEGVAYSAGRADTNRLPFAALARTLSFAFAEGARRYGDMLATTDELVERIKSGWEAARELTHQTPLELPANVISELWAMILNVSSNSGTNNQRSASELLLCEALQGVKDSGLVPRSTWEKLAGRVLSGVPPQESLEGPREARVRTVEHAIRELTNRREGSRWERAFVAGYMASRIQPGSLDHFTVLFPAISELRESLLWYGACAGLAPNNEIASYGNGVGWLIKRELRDRLHWLDRPSSDIALPELAVLMGGRDGGKPTMPTVSTGVLKVELVPLVSTSVRWPVQSEESTADKRMAPKTLFSEDVRIREEVLEILRRIDDSAMSLDAIRRRVETAFGERRPKNRRRK